MMKTITLTATLVSAIAFSSASMARNIQSDLEGDFLYGKVQLNASPSEAYVVNGPVQNGTEGDVLYNQDRYEPTAGFQGAERIADDRDLATDLIYGS